MGNERVMWGLHPIRWREYGIHLRIHGARQINPQKQSYGQNLQESVKQVNQIFLHSKSCYWSQSLNKLNYLYIGFPPLFLNQSTMYTRSSLVSGVTSHGRDAVRPNTASTSTVDTEKKKKKIFTLKPSKQIREEKHWGATVYTKTIKIKIIYRI